MNQILVTEKLYITPELKRKKKIYQSSFIISIFLIVMLCSAYVYAQYDRNKNEELSQDILASMIIEQENLIEENIIQDLNEKYFKIKECLSRCGNAVLECNKEETKNILFSFFNLKKFLEN